MRREKPILRTVAEPLLAAVALALALRAGIQLYAIPSASMSPTLEPGDGILATPYLLASPRQGDVVVFRSPAGNGEFLVKRIVAVPGDLIDSRLGRVRIGGYTLTEPYLRRQTESGMIPAQIVPERSYFVLGDNRAESVDSRAWGVIPEEQIVARARVVIWSGGADDVRRANASTARSRGPGDSHRRLPSPRLTWID
jgi:signal peptidase I